MRLLLLLEQGESKRLQDFSTTKIVHGTLLDQTPPPKLHGRNHINLQKAASRRSNDVCLDLLEKFSPFLLQVLDALYQD